MRNTVVLIMASLAISAAVLHAQAPQPRIWQGVFTAAQAERGNATFSTTCLRCHGADLGGNTAPALTGERFMAAWGDGSVARLFGTIRDTMPPFATSSIDDATKLDIVAFILQSNGFPTADRELAAGDLESIQIVPKEQQSAVQNFARVQVVGCLASGDANRFVLTSASKPVAASDAGATNAALGSGRILLLNAAPFGPAGQIGQKVEARGIIYRDERETLMAVTALKTLGACRN